MYVSKLEAAEIAQILLVVVNISVAYKSVSSEARLNISHRRRDLLSTLYFGLLYPLLFELSALIPDPAFSQGLLDAFTNAYLFLFSVLEH